ncbi:MAG: nucleotidyltransferase domain-containing protein [Planctomycetota bacterium]|nr:nucleotidyltransferase domain-containing protein [Planctomycetota bacterium]
MITVTDEVLDEMVRAIVREVDPEQIWLFGSRARGEAGPDSDVDLLVVEREPFGPERSRWKELTRLWSAIIPFRAPVDILLYTQDEVGRYKTWANHVVAETFREGRLLYERA